MELVPPNSEKMTKFTEDSSIPIKQVEVQVRACQTLICFAKLQQKAKVWQTLTWTFTFWVGFFFLSSVNLLIFLDGTSRKKHPVFEYYISFI